jgi:signal transduction histidine kinase
MPIPKGYTLSFYIVPLAVAVLAWLVCAQWAEFDAQLFVRLLTASHLGEAGDITHVGLDWANAVLILVAAGLSFLSGFRLSTTARAFTAVQIFVGMLVIQCFVIHSTHFAGHPIADAVTVALGVFGGFAMRRLIAELPERLEAQYYELIVRNKELQETRLQLVKQDETERRILAADLHDQVLNDLKILKQKIAEYGVTSDSSVGGEIDRHLNQAMEQVREVMDSLCPSVLEHLGLVAAIEDCLRRGGERSGFKTRCKSQVEQPEKIAALSMVEQTLIFRLVQESVTNVCKHAGASVVRGSVELKDDRLTVQVSDDGRGMDAALASGESRGVRYMRQRADLIGATISWRRGEGGKGTTVEICMDLTGRIGS